MMLNESFLGCIDSLFEVASTFRRVTTGTIESAESPDKYAFLLMDIACRQIEAFAVVATNPEPGLHFHAAGAIARVAFENAITAFWIAKPNDVPEREVRFLRWLRNEVMELENVKLKLAPHDPRQSEWYERQIQAIESNGNVYAKKRDMEWTKGKPTLRDMVIDVTGNDHAYCLYLTGCEFAHARLTQIMQVWEGRDKFLRAKDIDFTSWADIIRQASWCLAVTAPQILFRIGVPAEDINEITHAHRQLLLKVSVLDGSKSEFACSD